MSALFLPTLLASLAGGLHCAGMCGPFSAACGLEANGQARLSRQLPYHLGRLLTYGALGGAAGALGHALDLGGKLAGFSRLSALVAGATMIAFGLAPFLARWGRPTAGNAPENAGKFLVLGRGPESAPRLLTRVLTKIAAQKPMQRALLLGLTTTLLPCGWLYAFVALAAGTGAFSAGLTTMVAFWCGTLPWLFGASLGLRALVPRFGARARSVSAVLIAVAGIALIVLRAGPGWVGTPDAPGEHGAPPVSCPLHAR